MAGYRSPYNYGEDQTPDQQGTMRTDQMIQGPGGAGGPKPYMPPRTENQLSAPQQQQPSQGQQAAPPITFAQMQASGMARPPMPQPVQQLPMQAMMAGDANPQQMATPQAPAPPDTSHMDARSAAAAQQAWNDNPLVTQNWDASKAALSAQNNAQTDQMNSANYAQLANGLNSQAGYAGSGMNFLDPTRPQDYGKGLGTANPLDAAHSPIPGVGAPSGVALPAAAPAQSNGNLIPANNSQTPGLAPGQTSTLPTTAAASSGTAPSTGNTGPGGTFDLLNQLTQGAAGQGAGSQLQNATQDAALNYLKNPDPYGSQDVQNQYKYLSGNIDDQYKLQQRALGEEMARRGLGDSTNYGGRLQDLNIGQRSANEVLGTDLAHQFAQNYGSSQQAALGLGNTIGTQGQQNSQSWLNQLMGYGQNAFNNDLATNALNQNSQNNYQNYILQLLGMGYSG